MLAEASLLYQSHVFHFLSSTRHRHLRTFFGSFSRQKLLCPHGQMEVSTLYPFLRLISGVYSIFGVTGLSATKGFNPRTNTKKWRILHENLKYSPEFQKEWTH